MRTDRQLIEQRLKDSAGRHFGEVKGAAGLSEIKSARFRAGGVYVYPLRRNAGRNTLGPGVAQRVDLQFGIVCVARNVSDARGGDSTDVIEEMAEHVRAALLGWCPSEEHESMVYAGGGQVGFLDQFVLWQEIYATATYWRAAQC